MTDEEQTPTRLTSQFQKLKLLPIRTRLLLHFAGIIIGILLGAFVVFQILFLSKVIPHGGF